MTNDTLILMIDLKKKTYFSYLQLFVTILLTNSIVKK